MTEEEKLEITNEINDINQYICSIVNKFEYKLKLDINKYCDNFIDIKENDIKRLVELIKLKNDELKTKYDILIITYANDENLLNNAVDKNADITNIEDEFKSIPIVVERDYETEFYNLIDQIHVNMEEFELKDTLKIELIEYISELISNDEIFKTKIDILNAYVDKLVETSK
jgi:hypothetical protein